MPASPRWELIEQLFGEALDLPPLDREPFLATISDTAVRAEVQSLLAHIAPDAAFIESAIGTVAGQWLASAEAPAAGVGPGRRIGAYEIVGTLGQGGMGAVYRARRADGHFDQDVAIKVVRAGLETPAALERFRQERQILARLTHPSIARLLDGGTTSADEGPPFPYLAMEYVEGVPITAYCTSRGLSVAERIALFRRVCDAVQYAHQQLIVHRDLKPSNILVTADGTPKLLDFGIAKLLTEDADQLGALTSTGMPLLTPDYASPEQVRGEPVTAAADIYALGTLLYELLAGQKAHQFKTMSPLEIGRVICDTEATRPSSAVPAAAPGSTRLRRQLEGDLDTIVLKALRKEPERRYQSADHLSSDLRRYLEGRPVLARPDTFGYRSRKFVRRNRWALAAGSLIAASLIVGTVVSVWQARRAERRFEQVRRLANALMYDVHDEIRQLPGSTRARQKIVNTALEYLHGLEADATGDSRLEQDLAAAYLRIGDVQGGVLEANLGQTDAAIESYRKARALFERSGGPSRARSLAEVDTDIGDTLGYRADTKGALEAYATAVAELAPVANGPSATTADVRQLALVYQSQARLLGRLNQLDESLASSMRALAAQQRLVEMEPDNREWRFRMGGSEAQVSAALHRLGRPAEALPHAQKALALREEEAAGQPDNAVGQRNLMLGYNHVAEILGSPTLPSLGDTAGAVIMYRRMTAIAEKLVAADRTDRRSKWDLANCFLRLGGALAAAGTGDEALQRLGDAGEILRDLLKTDSRDNRARAALADVDLRLAELQAARGNPAAAMVRYDEAIREAEASVAADRGEALSAATLANALGGRAMLHARSSQRSAAVADARRQVELREQGQRAQPNAAPPMVTLARAYAVSARVYQTLGTPADRAASCQWLSKSRQAYADALARASGAVDGASRRDLELVERDVAASCGSR